MAQCRKEKITWIEIGRYTVGGKQFRHFKNPIKADNSNAHLFKKSAVPCRKCLPCALNKINEISIRADNEAQIFGYDNCQFITFTAMPEKLESAFPNGLVNKETFQNFMKKLRGSKKNIRQGVREITHPTTGKKYKPIRVMYCGEYGEKKGRPHYHAIIFNYRFKDLEITNNTTKDGYPLFRSKELEKLWGFGECYIGEVNKETCAYVAGYTVKSGLKKKQYENLPKENQEFLQTPRGFGLGKLWIDKYIKNVYDVGYVGIMKRGNSNRKGGLVKCKPPRYYDDQLDKLDPQRLEEIKEQRRIEGEEREFKKFKGNARYKKTRQSVEERIASAKMALTMPRNKI